MARYDARNLAQRISREADSGPILRRHKGTITDVNVDGTVDLTLDGGSVVLSGIRKLDNLVLSVDDVVEVLIDNTDIFVLGKIANDNSTIVSDYLPLVGGTLVGTDDVTLADGSGVLQVGPNGGLNMGLDGNEIQARDGEGAASDLHLQNGGGKVVLGSSGLIERQGAAWGGLSFASGWSNYTGGGSYATAKYRKLPTGLVVVKGLVVSTGGASDTIGTLPVGYRPTDGRVMFATVADGSFGRVDVSTAGTITRAAGTSTSYFSLSPITFYAEG